MSDLKKNPSFLSQVILGSISIACALVAQDMMYRDVHIAVRVVESPSLEVLGTLLSSSPNHANVYANLWSSMSLAIRNNAVNVQQGRDLRSWNRAVVQIAIADSGRLLGLGSAIENAWADLLNMPAMLDVEFDNDELIASLDYMAGIAEDASNGLRFSYTGRDTRRLQQRPARLDR